MERPKTTKNVGQPCVICGQSADAQATIAALQARVPELEQAVKETHGRFISEQAAKKDVIEELTVALKSNADGQVLIDKLMQDVLKLEAQLTQRTAELEAANHSAQTFQALWREACDQRDKAQAELERVKQALCDADERASEYQKALHDFESERALPLSIELERVRGELQSAEAGYFVAERELQGVNNKYDELRTLIAALPKVEGEIAVKRTEVDLSDVWGITLNGYFTFQSALFDGKEEAESYAAILKHRQGME